MRIAAALFALAIIATQACAASSPRAGAGQPPPAAAGQTHAPFTPGQSVDAPLAADGEIPTPARQLLLMDFETGQVLYEKEGLVPMKPASMAKLMTACVIFEKIASGELKDDTLFTVSEKAWRISVGGRSASSKMFLEVGSQIKLIDLLRGIIIQSGNDATIVAAEGIAGSEEAFADLMNATARKIGMKNSTFRNSSGLPDPEQWVTAHDLALLARHLISNYPGYYRIYSEREFTWNKIRQANRNPLLGRFQGADGLKTGHTSESGYGLVGSAIRDGRRVIMVINGLSSEAERSAEAARMLDLAFREFRSYSLFRPGQAISEAEVFGGQVSNVSLAVEKPVSLILRRAARPMLRAVVRYDGPLRAPVKRGDPVGTLTVTAPGMPPVKARVIANGSVRPMSILQTIELGFRSLTSGKAPQS